MFSKYLSLFILFVLTTFSFTIANAKSTVGSTYTGSASFYGSRHHGNKTASGERFNMYGLTAAHRTLPLGCTIRVTNKDNGKSVILKVNDRGPFHGNRVLDVSQGAAKQLGFIKQGLAKINIEVLSLPEKKLKVPNVKHTNLDERVNRIISSSASTKSNGIDGHSGSSLTGTNQSFNPTIGVGSRSYPGSTSYGNGSVGYSLLGYEGPADSISRLIASDYATPDDGK